MEIQKLKDICLTEITDGTHQTPTYSEYGYIFLSSKNVTTQKIDWDNVMFIPEKLHEELYKRVAPQIDDILLAKNGTTGVAAIVDRDIVFDIYVSLALIRPNTEIVMPRYLLYAINNPVVKGYFDSSLKGIGVPNLHLKNIRETPIKIYDLETQKAIVEKLDKVCELISLRKQQLEKLDELVKARFVEMFGDPYVNNKHYPLRKGESFFKLSNGKGVPEDKRLSNGVPAYGGNGISWYTNESLFNYDTIVVGRVGFQSGNVHIAKGPLWITDNAMYMSSCDFSQYNLIFLINLMEHIDFTRFQDAGDLKKITQKPFMQYEYLCPPLSLQNRFAAFVERVDQQKQTVQQSLEKLELMKKALMQEYFG